MTGILLAAGVGSRMRPLTDHLPKCLLPVGHQSLLPRTLSALQSAGLAECVLVTGYLQPLVEETVRSLGLAMPVRFVHNEKYATTNNNYSLWLAGRETGDNSILLLDADILFDPHLLHLLLASPVPDALLMREDDRLGAEEIKVALDGPYVRQIGKAITPSRAAGESIGIEMFSRETARQLFRVLDRRKEQDEFYEASFQEIIDRGARIAAVSTQGLPCMEIDTPDDLRVASALALTLGL